MGSKVTVLESALAVRLRIVEQSPSLYDEAVYAESDLYYTPEELSSLLARELRGSDQLADLAVRTRSKRAKELVAAALGYSVPDSFKRTQPRLPHPNVDVYAQQANNLQVWNQDLDSARRYVLVILDRDQSVSEVEVIAGADLANYDKTGTLTKKFQANRRDASAPSRLVSLKDTPALLAAYGPFERPNELGVTSPVAHPAPGLVLGIRDVYAALEPMVGMRFVNPGATQERNRGTAVHRHACERLGLGAFADNGRFPDVLCQALEIKLQLAPTVDLGLELPDADTPVASLDGVLAVRDTRYAVFYADADNDEFVLSKLVVTTGADFFTEFRQFGGKVSNSKLQLRLPKEWFS